jgi:hypothetical protein
VATVAQQVEPNGSLQAGTRMSALGVYAEGALSGKRWPALTKSRTKSRSRYSLEGVCQTNNKSVADGEVLETWEYNLCLSLVW